MISSCQQIKITALKLDTYPIERVERVHIKYGETILATLRAESPQTFLEVFLPRRYGFLFGDEDLRHINDKTVYLNLKYLRTHASEKFLHFGNRIDILVKFPDGALTRWYPQCRTPRRDCRHNQSHDVPRAISAYR